jgi:hypothetical protein
LAIFYSPSLFLEYKKQIDEIQIRINKDMEKFEKYAEDNHQPVNKNKTEFVIYYSSA